MCIIICLPTRFFIFSVFLINSSVVCLVAKSSQVNILHNNTTPPLTPASKDELLLVLYMLIQSRIHYKSMSHEFPQPKQPWTEEAR